ncbi:MAG: isoleucine--tRNA ligase [Candidatus Hydrogenedentes bacterium]|nr:isoleucine--tRNA ligase [Candidatus Hydrogenedentota bacterium]
MSEPVFEPVDARFNFSEAEKDTIRFWKENAIYHKSLEQRKGAPRFIFYEGPPTANGLPHPGHCLTRTIKDIFPRYKTMTGYYCERKAGWDTHGLPVEIEVCKELGIIEGGKAAIEEYGVERFNRACIESVFRYQKEWEDLTDRIGFWADLEDAYVTYHQSYVESVWWALKQLFDRGLLYQGHKVVWWWAQGGTALSSGEVGEGYRDIDEPAITVRLNLTEESKERFSLKGEAVSLLVWTTTPWTLLSNCAATVGSGIEYALVKVPTDDGHEHLILAKAVVERHFGDKAEIVDEFLGDALLGVEYEPLFNYGTPTVMEGTRDSDKHWLVIPGDFVDIEIGTGIVHTAPAFGEDDYRVCKETGVGFLCYVNPLGPFDERVTDLDPYGETPFAGQFCKDADKGIVRWLKDRGYLLRQDTYRHPYPFCPRAEDDPLIQYARRGWFIKTSDFVQDFLANNAEVAWQPEHIRDGRFGNFLENNVDWAISRERYWGTPLPVWVCEKTGHMECIDSYSELLAKPGVQGTEVWDKAKAETPDLSDHLKVHKPYIDAITYQSPKDPAARMRRVPEVIDVWFDAGSMPFAQWGYPHVEGSKKLFKESFPADFISEAIDQTRGWFYAQLAISTVVFGEKGPFEDKVVGWPHPFKNCICLGHILGEDGTKLSKRLKNYSEPAVLFEKFSADALRWSFIAKNPPTNSSRLSERIVEEAQRELLIRWHNVFSFFVIYANLDGFNPSNAPAEFMRGVVADPDSATEGGGEGSMPYSPRDSRSELDQWILEALDAAVFHVWGAMEAFESYPAARLITEFLDNLSNWYVRRSRPRFWAGESSREKADAYWTLYECLLTLARLAAPFTPFFAEVTWRNLTAPLKGAALSVHLATYPKVRDSDMSDLNETGQLISWELIDQMGDTRSAVTLGLSARRRANIKVRQPLALGEIILSDEHMRPGLEDHLDLIKDELNIKRIEFADNPDEYVSYEIKPNFKVLGPRFGKKVKAIGKALSEGDGAAFYAQVQDGALTLDVDGETIELSGDEVEVRLSPKEGFTAAQGKGLVVVLSTEITDELRREGWMRELIRCVQDMRKSMGLAYDARIDLRVHTADSDLARTTEAFQETISKEVLADSLALVDSPPGNAKEFEIEKAKVAIAIAEK